MTIHASWTPPYVFIFLAFFSTLPAYVVGISGEARLIRDILRDYTVESRPVKHTSHVIHINISMTLNHIISLDEKREIFTSVVWIEQTWRDQVVSWNASDYDDTDEIYLTADRIWTPDLYLYNLVGESHNMAGMFIGADREMLVLRSTGIVLDYMPIKMETSCQVDLTRFPFDTQTCRITMGSWVYSEDKLIYQLGAAPSEEVDHEGAWRIVHLGYERTIYREVDLGTNYTFIHFDITMKRNPLFYILNLIIPSYLMNGIMVMSLFLPPECGERMSVGLTVFMAYSVFSLIISDIVPASAHSPPVICILFISSMLYTLVTIGWTVLVIRIHNCAATWHYPPPHWLYRLLCRSEDSSQTSTSCCCCNLNHLNSRQRRCQSQTSKTKRDHDVSRTRLEPEVLSSRAHSGENGQEMKEGRGLIVTESRDEWTAHVEGAHRENKLTGPEILDKWKKLSIKADKIFALIYMIASLVGILIIAVQM